jgi:hypothetical protein
MHKEPGIKILAFLSLLFLTPNWGYSEFDLEKAYFLDESSRDNVLKFFEYASKGQENEVYQLASNEFKSQYPQDYFAKSVGDWRLRGARIHSVQVSESSGFMLICSFDVTWSRESVYQAFFWRFEDDGARYIHFPFRSRGLHDLLDLRCVYEK